MGTRHAESVVLFLTIFMVSVHPNPLGLLGQEGAGILNSPHCPFHGTWKLWDGNCYLFMDMEYALTWKEAETICIETYSSHLTSILSKEENDFIFSNINEAWIGLTDLNNERGTSPTGWTWVDGSVFEYQHWDVYKSVNGFHIKKQPDGGVRENCGFFAFDGCWFDDPCANKYITRRFVCKTPASNFVLALTATEGDVTVTPSAATSTGATSAGATSTGATSPGATSAGETLAPGSTTLAPESTTLTSLNATSIPVNATSISVNATSISVNATSISANATAASSEVLSTTVLTNSTSP